MYSRAKPPISRRRSLWRLTLLVSSAGALVACPQLADDDFVKADAPEAHGYGGSPAEDTTTSVLPLGGSLSDPSGFSATTTGIGTTSGSAGTLSGSGGEEETDSDSASTTGSTANGGMGGTQASGGRGGAANAAGGTSAATSTNTGSGGSGGSAVMDCSDKRRLTEGLITDFETYDGITEPLDWRFEFSVDTGPVYGEPIDYQDGSGQYSLAFVAGYAGSTYALKAQNPAADNWGGGVALRIHCVDASNFGGLSFAIRSVTPAGSAEVALVLEDSSKVVYQFEVSDMWQSQEVDFGAFEASPQNPRASTDGNGIQGIVFSSQLRYVRNLRGDWEPVEGAFELTVDDIAFYE